MDHEEQDRKVPTGLARALVLLLGVHAGLGLARAAVAISARGDLAVGAGVEVTAPDLVSGRGLLSGTAQAGLVVVTAAVFIWWMYGLAKLVSARRPDALRRSPAWAVWGWFIPIGLLYLPKDTAKDLWKGTSQGYSHDSPPRLLHAWWGFWLLTQLLMPVVPTMLRTGGPNASPAGPGDLEALRLELLWLALSGLVVATAALLALAVVRALTQRAVEWRPPRPPPAPRDGSGRPAAVTAHPAEAWSDEAFEQKWRRWDSSQS